MKNKKRINLSLTAGIVIIGVILVISCFSFAENNKKPYELGSTKKPELEQREGLEAFKNLFSDIAKEVTPTVVTIRSTRIDTIKYIDPFERFFNSPFDQFFSPRGRGRDRGKRPEPRKKERRSSGLGSGVIVSSDGYILTNYHVIGDADEIVIATHDNREFDAEIIGIDSLSDVAVIKITQDVEDLPAAYFGNSSDVRPGDWVMAIGNPFNLSSTVTTGIVSAKGRHTSGISMYQNFIQIDAAINPGNSGGALVNLDGELIGINSMIYSRSGGYMGIGFAIPINMARNIMEQLIEKGEVERGWLGVQISDVDYNMKEALGLESTNGVMINNVFDGQPADKAGIKSGDVLISLDSIQLKNANQLKNTVAGIQPGKEIPVTVIRDGKEKTLRVELAKRSKENIAKASGEPGEPDKGKETKEEIKNIGITVGSITQEIREHHGINKRIKGAAVMEIDPASPAARKGLKKYDIITRVKVENRPMAFIKGPDAFKKAISNLTKGSSVLFQVIRGDDTFFIAMKVH
ncbi:MAG: DegQ family serine endoprotease [Chitinivibrionales bacterium]